MGKYKYLTVGELQQMKVIPQVDYLTYLFNEVGMFEDCYMRVQNMNMRGEIEEFIYDIGVDSNDLAKVFGALFEHRPLERRIHIDNPKPDVDKIKRKMHSVIAMLLPKYLKQIETYGYRYEPLANVDATELHGTVDNNAGTTSSSSSNNSNTSHAETNVKTTSTSVNGGEVATPTTNLYETQYDDTGKSDANLKSYTTSEGGSTATQTANKDDNYSDSTASSVAAINSQANYDRIQAIVAAKDNPFGFSNNLATGYHIEKTRRVGNIGTTMTTQLIEAERNCYRSLVEGFLKDIAYNICLPTYDFEEDDEEEIYYI